MRRSRSVRLGKGGISRLILAMESEQQKNSRGKRMTREQKGEILGGLSVATVDKLLQGRLVDRATVELAFRSVGLVLSDDDIVREALTQPGSEGAESSPSLEATKGRARRRPIVIVAVLMVILALVAQSAIVGFGRKSSTPSDLSFWYGTWRLKSMNIGKQTTGCPGKIVHNGITTTCDAEVWTLNPDGTAVINGEIGKWHTKDGEFSLFLKGVGHGFTVSRADTFFILRYDLATQSWSEFYFFERAEPGPRESSR